MMNQNIKVFNDKGESMEAKVLLSFKLPNSEKEYILYTFNEKDPQNMETIHASELVKENEEYYLNTIEDQQWEDVKDVMRDVIRSKGE